MVDLCLIASTGWKKQEVQRLHQNGTVLENPPQDHLLP